MKTASLIGIMILMAPLLMFIAVLSALGRLMEDTTTNLLRPR